MKLSIAHLRAAGLTDAQIIKVMEEAEAERREKARIIKRNQRARPQDKVDTEDKHISVSTSLPKKERKERKKAIGTDWQPTSADRDYAKGEGWSDDRIDREIVRFRNYYLANGKTMQSWSPKWQNWVTSAYQSGGQSGSSQVRSSGQQAGGLTEAIAKVRSRLGANADRPSDVVIPQDRLPKPRGFHSDVGRDLGGLPAGDRGIHHGPEDGPAAPLQMAADASGSSRGVRSRDRLANEDSPELKLVAGTEVAAAALQRRG